MSEMETSRSTPAAPKLSAVEAQDAIAGTFGKLEKLAWHFFVIARDLEVDLDDENLPERKPGPDHLRWFTALSAMALYSELIEALNNARKAAERSHQDLINDWEKKERPQRPPGLLSPPAAKAQRKKGPN
jgi:hypothetical protein